MVETTVFRQLFFRCELALSPNKVLLNSRLKIDNKSLVETCTTINCLPEVNVEKEEIYFINKIPKKVKVIIPLKNRFENTFYAKKYLLDGKYQMNKDDVKDDEWKIVKYCRIIIVFFIVNQ